MICTVYRKTLLYALLINNINRKTTIRLKLRENSASFS